MIERSSRAIHKDDWLDVAPRAIKKEDVWSPLSLNDWAKVQLEAVSF